MGDVLTLIEKAQETMDAEKMAKMEENLRKSRFTLEDFLQQTQEIRKMGDMKEMISMIPGMGKQLKNLEIDEKPIHSGRINHSQHDASRT